MAKAKKAVRRSIQERWDAGDPMPLRVACKLLGLSYPNLYRSIREGKIDEVGQRWLLRSFQDQKGSVYLYREDWLRFQEKLAGPVHPGELVPYVPRPNARTTGKQAEELAS